MTKFGTLTLFFSLVGVAPSAFSGNAFQVFKAHNLTSYTKRLALACKLHDEAKLIFDVKTNPSISPSATRLFEDDTRCWYSGTERQNKMLADYLLKEKDQVRPAVQTSQIKIVKIQPDWPSESNLGIDENFNLNLKLKSSLCIGENSVKPSSLTTGNKKSQLSLFPSGLYRMQFEEIGRNKCQLDILGQYERNFERPTQIRMTVTHKVLRCGESEKSLKIKKSEIKRIYEAELSSETFDIGDVYSKDSDFCAKGEALILNWSYN